MSRPLASSVEVEGLTELTKAYKAAAGADGRKSANGVIKAAAKKAADPVADEAQRLSPKDLGVLAATVRAGSDAKGTGIVRAGGSRVAYAGPIHFGWPGHGIEPQPFLYDALDNRRAEVLQAFEKAVGEITDAMNTIQT